MTAHVLTAAVIGAGCGDTYYVVMCSCGWRHEDYSAMSAHGRAVMHQREAGR